MVKVFQEAGFDQELAVKKSEDAAIAIQDALILTQGLDSISIF